MYPVDAMVEHQARVEVVQQIMQEDGSMPDDDPAIHGWYALVELMVKFGCVDDECVRDIGKVTKDGEQEVKHICGR